MTYLLIIIPIAISMGIVHVWLLRFNQPSKWRGGNASNMKEEFATYGLPVWFMYSVGFLKISMAISLMMSFWFPVLRIPSALGIAVLMLGAIAMHIKIRDPFQKSLPALTLLILSLITVIVPYG